MKQHGYIPGIVAASLGFFVDLYDIIIVSVVRRSSLLGVGVPESELLSKGVLLLNAQMLGMLIGGFFWGILGDKRGRLSVLFGSIFLYSITTLATAYAPNYAMFLALRFLAGIGLAGELGAGITLVSEQMPQQKRGLGPAIIGSCGMLGALMGAWVGGRYSWQFTYQLGGLMGFALLLLRLSVLESGLFEAIKKTQQASMRGNLAILFGHPHHRRRYLAVILMGFPGWFVNGIVMTFTPEIAQSMGMSPVPSVATVFTMFFLGFTFGDFSCGLVSQWLQSRKQAILLYLSVFSLLTVAYFAVGRLSLQVYYALFLLMGVSVGYTIVLLTNAAEMFGTNIRSTVTTSALNLLRASVIPQSLFFSALTPAVGAAAAAAITGVCSLGLAFWAFNQLEETFHKNLDFLD
ncbi:MAG: MFS transporter [Saprospiraceae bacterium]|nr:MFS transporter [Saprospiraceae bacterium]MDW8228221.1 MFS transporter [Saprospiraceae bacterium]